MLELTVPVPWGHIAVKAWGNPDNEAVLVLHGLLDNAGSFDTLIPLLPQYFYYLCIDLPGHGLSSYFPASLPIVYVNFIFAMHCVTEYFKRDKYIVLGHSLGGRIALLFTQMYPRVVSKLALLDTGYTFPNPPERYLESLIRGFNLLKKTLSYTPESKPSYSYDEIVYKIINSRFMGTLTFETAEQLAKRMVKEVGSDKYELTYDPRLREILYPSFSEKYISDIFKQFPIKCPTLVIYASNTKKAFGKSKLKKLMMLPHFRSIKSVEIDGHHHSHHTNPELFAPILTKFFLAQKNKL